MLRSRLQQYIEATDLTQRDLAEQLGRSKTTINKIARGETTEYLDTVLQICEFFGIELGDLLYIQRRAEEEPER